MAITTQWCCDGELLGGGGGGRPAWKAPYVRNKATHAPTTSSTSGSQLRQEVDQAHIEQNGRSLR